MHKRFIDINFKSLYPHSRKVMKETSKRRPRLTLVCESCKKKRIKCDKGHPCSNCRKSNKTCKYDTSYLQQLPYVSSAKRPIVLGSDSSSASLKNSNPFSRSNELTDFLKIPSQSNQSRAGTDSPLDPPNEIPPWSNNNLIAGGSTTAGGISSSNSSSTGPGLNNDKIVIDRHELETLKQKISELEQKDRTLLTLPSLNTYSNSSHNIQLPPLNLPTMNNLTNDNVSLLGENPFNNVHDTLDFTEFDEIPFSYKSKMNLTQGLKLLYEENDNFDVDFDKIEFCYDPTDQFSIEEQNVSLNDKILLILPSKQNFWVLVDSFFQKLCHILPVCNTSELTKDFIRIFGEKELTNEKFNRININDNRDYLIICFALLFIRFGYLLLTNNNKLTNESIKNYDPEVVENSKLSNEEKEDILFLRQLLNLPVTLKIHRVINNCLSLFPFNSNGKNFLLFQFLFYYRIYFIYAPESSGSALGNDTMYLQTLLLNMSKAFGFNKRKNICNLTDGEYKSGRRIYVCIILQEYYQIAINGIIDVNNFYFDYEPLHVEELMFEDDSPETRINLEVFVVVWNNLLESCTNNYNLVRFSYKAVNIKQLTKSISNIESTIDRKIIPKIIENHLFSLLRVFYEKQLLVGYNLFFVSNFIHLQHYFTDHNNNELSFFYNKKIFIKLYEIMDFLTNLINNEINFKVLNYFIVNSILQNFLNICLIFLMNYVIKFKFILKREIINGNNYLLTVQSIHDLFVKHCKFLLKLLHEFSHYYYYSWKVFRITYFYFRVITGDEFYEKNKLLSDEVVSPILSTDQLNEIYSITNIDIPYQDDESFNFPGIAKTDEKWVNYYRYNNTQKFDIFNEVS